MSVSITRHNAPISATSFDFKKYEPIKNVHVQHDQSDGKDIVVVEVNGMVIFKHDANEKNMTAKISKQKVI